MSTITIKSIDTRPDLDVYRRDTNGETYTELTIYPAERMVVVSQEGHSNSQTMDEYHRIDLSERIEGHPDETETREFLEGEEGQALLARICDGHDREWNGSNWIGTLTKDAQDALEILVGELNDLPASEWEFWAIDDWASTWADENITGDMTDEQVTAKAAELDALAEAEHVNLSSGAVDYLTGIRNDKREDDE